MSIKQFFAFQPIVDSTPTSVAVELIYHDEDLFAETSNTIANLVLNAFVHVGPDELPRRRRTYLKIPPQLVGSELLAQFKPELFVLELRCDDPTALLEPCRTLKQAGYEVALNNVGSESDALQRLLPYVNTVRVNGHAVLNGQVDILRGLRASGVQLLADNVDHQDMVEKLKPLGFRLFQGYHFARPADLSITRIDPRKVAVLDLLNKLAGDEDDPVIEEAFKANPALAFDLLKLVNSAAYSLKTRIRSIKHAFAILGRKELERWMRVLLFAFDGDMPPSPLMELALRRARFMEYVLTYLTHQGSTVLQDEAYMTGMLSLVDVLLGWTMQDCVQHLSLADEIGAALQHREGTLGHLIDLCEALEAADFDAVVPIAEALHLPLDSIMAAQNVALAYAESIGLGNNEADEQQHGHDGGEDNAD